MKISVIIPTRDRPAMLRDSIASALTQSRAPAQIVVVDNGSSDATRAVADEFADKIEFLREPRPGKSWALNTGMSKVTGDAVLVLDDDDVLPDDALERHAAALLESPSANFSYGRFQRFYGSAPAQPAVDFAHPVVQDICVRDDRRTVIKLMEDCFLPNPTWLARRSALVEAGPYDVAALRSQDYDMILRLCRINEGVPVDAIVLYQRQHAGVRPGARATIGSDDLTAAWNVHDRRIFENIARTWSLSAFRPLQRDFADEPVTERICLLQKGVLLFVRGCYEQAFTALRSHREQLSSHAPDKLELAVVSRMFIRHFMLGIIDGETVEMMRRLNDLHWPETLKIAAVKGARWCVRSAFSSQNVMQGGRMLGLFNTAFGPISTATGLVTRRPIQMFHNDLL